MSADFLNLELWAKLLTSGHGVYGVVAIIVTVAIYNWIRFKKKIKPCIRDMQKANQLLTKIGTDEEGSSEEEIFAEYYDEFDEEIKKVEILRHPWSEFTETLIIDENVVRNTHSVKSYFARDDLLGNRVDLRYYSSFPNILTGTGILGTFMGLVSGIYLASDSLLSNDPTLTRAALSTLLSGASLAFLTSIAGLLLSIIFSMLEKKEIHQFEKLRRKWVVDIDKRLQRVTIESINKLVHDEAIKQTRVLQDFGEPLAFQLAEQMGKTLTHTVTAPMSEALTGIQDSIDELIKAQTNSSAEMLEQVTEKMTTSITGSASKEMEDFSSGIAYVTSALEQTMDRVSTQMNDATKSFTSSVQGLSESSRNIEKMIAGSAQLTEQQRELMDESKEVNDKLVQVSESIESAITAIGESIEKGAEITAEASRSVESIQTSVTELKDSNDQLKNLWSDYEKRFEGVDESLGLVFKEIDEGTQRYAEMMKNSVGELDTQTASMVKMIAGAVGDLSAAVEELSDVLQSK